MWSKRSAADFLGASATQTAMAKAGAIPRAQSPDEIEVARRTPAGKVVTLFDFSEVTATTPWANGTGFRTVAPLDAVIDTKQPYPSFDFPMVIADSWGESFQLLEARKDYTALRWDGAQKRSVPVEVTAQLVGRPEISAICTADPTHRGRLTYEEASARQRYSSGKPVLACPDCGADCKYVYGENFTMDATRRQHLRQMARDAVSMGAEFGNLDVLPTIFRAVGYAHRIIEGLTQAEDAFRNAFEEINHGKATMVPIRFRVDCPGIPYTCKDPLSIAAAEAIAARGGKRTVQELLRRPETIVLALPEVPIGLVEYSVLKDANLIHEVAPRRSRRENTRAPVPEVVI